MSKKQKTKDIKDIKDNCSIPEKQIINKDYYEAYKCILECPICLNLTFNPQMCKTCEYVYCGKCVIKISKCSFCNSIEGFAPISKGISRMYQKLILECPKEKCKVSISDYLSHIQSCYSCESCKELAIKISDLNSKLEKQKESLNTLVLYESIIKKAIISDDYFKNDDKSILVQYIMQSRVGYKLIKNESKYVKNLDESSKNTIRTLSVFVLKDNLIAIYTGDSCWSDKEYFSDKKMFTFNMLTNTRKTYDPSKCAFEQGMYFKYLKNNGYIFDTYYVQTNHYTFMRYIKKLNSKNDSIDILDQYDDIKFYYFFSILENQCE